MLAGLGAASTYRPCVSLPLMGTPGADSILRWKALETAGHPDLQQEEQADGADNVEEKKPAAKRTARKTTTRRKATSADGEPKTTRKRSTAKASTKTSAKDTTAKAVAAKAKAKDTTAKAKAPAKRRTAKKNNVELQLTGDNPQMAVEIENTIQNV